MDDAERNFIARLRSVAEDGIERLDAAKMKFAGLRDALDHVLDEVRAFRDDDEEEDDIVEDDGAA